MREWLDPRYSVGKTVKLIPLILSTAFAGALIKSLARETMINVQFHASGKVTAWSRAAGNKRRYNSPALTAYKGYIGLLATQAFAAARQLPFSGPVGLSLIFIKEVPASWSAEKRKKALAGIIAPDLDPDLSNLTKGIEDALIGIAYIDDNQIVKSNQEKIYGSTPGVTVQIYHTGLESAKA